MRGIQALALLLVGVQTARAQDAQDDLFDEGLDELLSGEDIQGIGAGEDGVLRGFKGFVEAKPRHYFEDVPGKADGQLLFLAELEFDFRFRHDLTAYFRPRILVDLLDTDLTRYEPYEAYVSWEREKWDLRVGQFVENWGIADTLNPLDTLNRRDIATDLLDPERVGEFGFRWRRLFEGNTTVGEPTLALYLMPVWRESLFAPEDQRFSFDSASVEFNESAGFEPEGSERVYYAARFVNTLDTSVVNADIQLVSSYGPVHPPAIILNANGDAVPAYYGAASFGLGLRAVPNQDAAGRFLSTLTLKGEIAYSAPYAFDDSPIEDPDDYIAYVIGIDREFYAVTSEQDSLTLMLEYAGENGASDPTTILRPFRDDLILRAFWQRNDFARTALDLRGIIDLDTDETIFEGIFERQLRWIDEDLKLIVQLQLFDTPGTGESIYDLFPDNSSIAVGIRWDF